MMKGSQEKGGRAVPHSMLPGAVADEPLVPKGDGSERAQIDPANRVISILPAGTMTRGGCVWNSFTTQSDDR